jgi:hypothetical protein
MKSHPKTSAEFDKFLHFIRHSMSVPGAEVKAQIEREQEVRGKKKRTEALTRTRMERG